MVLTIAFDPVLRRPGCAIVQATFGATVNVSAHFDPDTWLVAPTPDMQVFPVEPAQLPMLSMLARRATDEAVA